MNCSSCNKPVKDSEILCPHCGNFIVRPIQDIGEEDNAPLQSNEKVSMPPISSKKKIAIFIGSILVLLLVVLVLNISKIKEIFTETPNVNNPNKNSNNEKPSVEEPILSSLKCKKEELLTNTYYITTIEIDFENDQEERFSGLTEIKYFDSFQYQVEKSLMQSNKDCSFEDDKSIISFSITDIKGHENIIGTIPDDLPRNKTYDDYNEYFVSLDYNCDAPVPQVTKLVCSGNEATSGYTQEINVNMNFIGQRFKNSTATELYRFNNIQACASFINQNQNILSEEKARKVQNCTMSLNYTESILDYAKETSWPNNTKYYDDIKSYFITDRNYICN